MHVATKLDRMVTYLEEVLVIKSYDNIMMWSHKLKNTSTITMLMITKLVWMVTYLEQLLPIKSRDHIIT